MRQMIFASPIGETGSSTNPRESIRNRRVDDVRSSLRKCSQRERNCHQSLMMVSATIDEWRAVIRFCVLLDKSITQIFELLDEAYKGNVPSRASVYRWAGLFRAGHTRITDAPRSGRPRETVGLAGVILDLLDERPFASLREIAEVVHFDAETVRLCLSRELGYKKYTSRWVPHKLSEGQKRERVEAAHVMLRQLRCKRRGSFITADESWFRYEHFPDGAWAAASEDVQARERQRLSPQKTMIIVFWGVGGFHYIEVLPANTTLTGCYAADLLRRLDVSVRSCRPKMGTHGMTLHWDNARPHRSAVVVETIRDLHMSQIPHPPYSPDLSPCDFFLFGEIKRRFKAEGRTFHNSDEVLAAVKAETASITRETREKVFDEWVRRLEYVIASGGDYVLD